MCNISPSSSIFHFTLPCIVLCPYFSAMFELSDNPSKTVECCVIETVERQPSQIDLPQKQADLFCSLVWSGLGLYCNRDVLRFF